MSSCFFRIPLFLTLIFAASAALGQCPTVDNPGNITVCSGGMLDVVFTGNSPTATYNWTASLPLFGGLNGTGNISFPVPTIPFPVSVSFTVTATENNCTSSPQVFTVSGFPLPNGSLALTGPASVCAGQSTPFSINFSNGANPYSFVYAVDGVEAPPISTGSNPYTLNLSLPNSATVSLVSVTSNMCTNAGNGSAAVTVTPVPTATLAGGSGTLCTGQDLDLEIDLTGEAPFNLVYSVNGVNQPPVTTSDPVYTLHVSPNAGNYTYALVSVSGNGCSGTVGGTYNLTVKQTPTASLAGDATVCAGQATILTLNFTGGSPYTVDYTADGVAQPTITAAGNLFTFSVTPSATTFYELTGLTANGCAGTLNGGALVTVNPAPTAALTSGNTNICNGQQVQLQLTFNGAGNYTFVYQHNGVNQPAVTAAGPSYQFAAPSGNGNNVYTLASVTANGCPGTTSGTFTATVGGAPTATLTGDQGVCPGAPAPLKIDFTGNGPYTVDYTANNVAQTPITTPNNPFIFNVNPLANTTYLLTGLNTNGCVGTFSGQAIVAINPGPTATLQGGGDTLCAGSADTLQVYLAGGGPYTVLYAINNVTQPPVVTSLDTLLLPLTLPLGADTVRLISVSNMACTGIVNGFHSYLARGAAGFFSADTTICYGDTAQLRLNFTGSAPFIYSYSVNGVLQGPDTVSTNRDTLFVSPTATTTYMLTGLSGGGCVSSQRDTAVVTVRPELTGEVSGGGQICQNGSGTQITFSFQGQGPYTFIYAINNVAQPPITTALNSYVLNVNPVIGSFYKLLSVSNGVCSGTVLGQQAVVFVFSPPTAFLSGSNTFCDSADTSVMIDFTGTGPFTIYYTLNGVDQMPITTFDDPFFLPVHTTTTATYVLTTTESPGCTGISMGTAVITVNHLPSYTNLDLNCDANNANYQVEFDVLNGAPPYTLVSGAGTFTGNHFVSNPLPVIQNYNFVFHDSGNCGDVTVSGVPNCNCTSDAGALTLNTQEICAGDTLVLSAATGVFVDNDDTLLYVLHTNAGLPFGTVLAWNGQPQFSLQPGMQTGVTYYVSSVVGNQLANGQIDQTDPCLSVAQGTPVIFHAAPTAAMAVLDTSICVGESVTLPVTFTGTPPFSLEYSISGVAQPVVSGINGNTYAILLTPAQSITVQLDSVGDQYCPSGMVSGQATVGVHGAPQLSPAAITCNYDSLTYVLSFDVTTGTPPYDVSGISGTFAGNTFTSFPYPFGEPYFIYVRDTFDCGVDTLSGIPACSCLSAAGTMSGTTLLKFCQSSAATAPHDGNQTLDGNDVLIFVLHTSAADSLGTILATNSTPVFNFLAGVTATGTTYYISAVVGNSDGAGGVIPTDPCLSVAPGTPVVWNAEPTGTISGTYDVCKGVPLAIKLTFTGQAPYQFSYTNNGQTVNATAVQNVYNIVANLQQTTTFILTSVQDANCPGTVSGQAVVTVHEAPDIINPVITCSADNLTYIVEFDVLHNTSATITGTVPGNLDQVTGHFISNAIPVQQNYAFQAADIQYNCGKDSISGVSACACITDSGNFGQMPLTLCVGDAAIAPPATGFVLDGNDTLLYYLATMPNPPTWTVLDISATPNFAYNSSTMTPGTTYYIVALAGNVLGGNVDLFDPCLSFATGPAVVWRVPPTATLSGAGDICPGASVDLNVKFTGAGPFDFTYEANGQAQTVTAATQPYVITVSPADTTSYSLVSLNGAGGCPGTVSGSAIVNVHAPPTATLSGDTTLCQGGSVAVQIESMGTPPFQLTYALNGIGQAPVSTPLNTFFISTGNIQTPQVFTLLGIQDGLCAGTVSGMATVSVNPVPTATLLQDATICAGDSALLTLQLSGGGPYDVTIGGGINPFQLAGVQSGASFSVSPTATTTYTIIGLTATGNNCPADIGPSVKVAVSNLTATATVSDFQGYNVSCANAADGTISISSSGGLLPLTAIWSTGETGLQIEDLPGGQYSVLLTDFAGCIYRDSFELTAPPAVDFTFTTQEPPCAGDVNGGLSVDSISGGTGPYTWSLNGQTAQAVGSLPLVVKPLPAGSYGLAVTDANGCSTEQAFSITPPPPLTVDLGPDVTLNFGDSTLLEAEVNSLAVQSFVWTPVTFLQQPGDQATWAKPTQTQAYEVQVQDTSGCKASDRILVIVDKTKRVYIPNIINLHADGYNNVLAVFAGPEVTNVRFLRVYDRWGECVYEGLNLPTNDPQFGWAGTFRNKYVLPGVYVYVTEVQYFDGTTEVFAGDVTVVN